MCGFPTRRRCRCRAAPSSPATGRPASTAAARRPASTTSCRAAAGARTPGTTSSRPAGAATTPRPTGRWPSSAGCCRTRLGRRPGPRGGCSAHAPSTRAGGRGSAGPGGALAGVARRARERLGVTSPATARRLWALGEPYHALSYFTAESRRAGEDVGLTGFWNGYFAFRAAPLGVVGAPVVTATFYNFAPAFVRRRVPGVWETVTPVQALAARLAGIDAAVRRVFGEEWPGSAEAAEAAELVRMAAEAVDVAGRPLAAAKG